MKGEVDGSNPSIGTIAEQRSGLSRYPHKLEIAGSNPASATTRGGAVGSSSGS